MDRYPRLYGAPPDGCRRGLAREPDMYAAHFGLRELPFNNTPDPRYFYATPDHEEALASLIYTVTELKGYVLLTGEVGTGKTLISRLMLRHFGDRVSSAVINNTSLSGDDLLEAICVEFNLNLPSCATRFERVRALENHLLAQFAANRPVVLVLDEGQNLPDEAFEELRMIGNLEADDAKLLQMVIVGQIELLDRFAAPGMRQLRQRIFRSFHLRALSAEVCAEYIRHRLSVARRGALVGDGAPGTADQEQVFNQNAIDLIYRHSQGLPRLINTLCDNAMLAAFAADRHQIDGEQMESVADQTLGLGSTARIGRGEPSPRLSQARVGGASRATPASETSGQNALAWLEPRLAGLEAHIAQLWERMQRLGIAAATRDRGLLLSDAPTGQTGADTPTATGMEPATKNQDRPDPQVVKDRLATLIERANRLLLHESESPQPEPRGQQRIERINRAVGEAWQNADQAVRRMTEASDADQATCDHLTGWPGGSETNGATAEPRWLQELAARSRTNLDVLRTLVRQNKAAPKTVTALPAMPLRRVDGAVHPADNANAQPGELESSMAPRCPTVELARHVHQLANLADASAAIL